MALSDTIYAFGQNPSYRGVLETIGDISQAENSVLKKLRSMGENEMTPSGIRDYNTNGFLSQTSVFKPSFFARMFDEPTYLTFKIEFMFNDPENEARNTAYNNQGVLNSALQTAYYPVMYDNMPEPLLDDYILTGKDVSTGKRYSSETYLDLNLGDHGRAQILHNFKMALRDIEINFPFYFTSIGGINKLASVSPEQGIRLKDCVLELECMEGIDLKITQLMQMYRKVVWDDVYQRWVLPDMMRYFGMRVYVSEMRLFSSHKREQDPVRTYNFGQTENREFTHTPTNNQRSWQDKTRDAVNQGNIVSQAFLGTKSVITQALDYTSATLTTGAEWYGNRIGIDNQIQYCNNAINEVMPTICFECHMCEFDISDTLSHIGTLSSSRNGAGELKPKLKIKVGQVKESHSYPLNQAMIGLESGEYIKSISVLQEAHQVPEDDLGFNSYNDLYALRGMFMQDKMYHPGNLTFAGNYMTDKTLGRRYSVEDLGKRMAQYVWYLDQDVGEDDQTISVKRLNFKRFNPSNKIDETAKMKYRPDDLPTSIAHAGLFTAAMNDAISMAYKLNINSNIVGTRSLATDQTATVRRSLQAVGEAMMAALDRIYNGEVMQSMAVQGIPDSVRAKIAENSFSEYIRNVEEHGKNDPVVITLINNYKSLMKTPYISKATNTTFSNIN